MNNGKTNINNDSLPENENGEAQKEPISDIKSSEKGEAAVSGDVFDALQEIVSERYEFDGTKASRDEYLTRFRSYDEFMIHNERSSAGGRIDNKAKKKKRKAAKIFRNILLFITFTTFVVSGSMIVKRGVDYYKMKGVNNQLENLTLSDTEITVKDTKSAEFLNNLIEKYPHLKNVEFPAGFNYKYALLYAANREFVGYLTIPGTNISTAVVRHSDDDFYYDHDFYGKATRYGAVFALAQNNMVNLDMNTVLIGHYMKDGARFHDLKYYKTADGYKKSPVIEFNTAYGDYKWKVYGAFILNGVKAGDDGYLLNCLFNNISQQSFEAYIAEIDKRTLYKTGVTLLATDKILTLMTCTYEFENARLIVIARMVRPGESEEVDLSLVLKKSAPIKYPQGYYDKKGKNNPYANDEKWYPEY